MIAGVSRMPASFVGLSRCGDRSGRSGPKRERAAVRHVPPVGSHDVSAQGRVIALLEILPQAEAAHLPRPDRGRPGGQPQIAGVRVHEADARYNRVRTTAVSIDVRTPADGHAVLGSEKVTAGADGPLRQQTRVDEYVVPVRPDALDEIVVEQHEAGVPRDADAGVDVVHRVLGHEPVGAARQADAAVLPRAPGIEVAVGVMNGGDDVADDELKTAVTLVAVAGKLNPVVTIPDEVVDEPDVLGRVLSAHADAEREPTWVMVVDAVLGEDHVGGLFRPQ